MFAGRGDKSRQVVGRICSLARALPDLNGDQSSLANQSGLESRGASRLELRPNSSPRLIDQPQLLQLARLERLAPAIDSARRPLKNNNLLELIIRLAAFGSPGSAPAGGSVRSFVRFASA